MQSIISVREDSGKQVVSAKELYTFLGYNPAHWSRWSTKNITDNEFAYEGEDYQGFTSMVNGNPTMDFAITIDFAKKLAMMARTEKGEQARQYFIEVEKKYKDQKPKELSMSEMTLMVIQNLQQETEAMKKQLQEQAPIVEYAAKVLSSESAISTTEVAQDLGISAIKLNRRLHDAHVIRKVNGSWVLTAPYLDKGYAVTKTHTFEFDGGTNRTYIHLYWTESGRNFIHTLFNTSLQPIDTLL